MPGLLGGRLFVCFLAADTLEFPLVCLLVHELTVRLVALCLFAGYRVADLRALLDHALSLAVTDRCILSHAVSPNRRCMLNATREFLRRCAKRSISSQADRGVLVRGPGRLRQ